MSTKKKRAPNGSIRLPGYKKPGNKYVPLTRPFTQEERIQRRDLMRKIREEDEVALHRFTVQSGNLSLPSLLTVNLDRYPFSSVRFYVGPNQDDWIDAHMHMQGLARGLEIRGASALQILPGGSNLVTVKLR